MGFVFTGGILMHDQAIQNEKNIKAMLSEEFGISHATIQLQTEDDYVNHINFPGIPQMH